MGVYSGKLKSQCTDPKESYGAGPDCSGEERAEYTSLWAARLCTVSDRDTSGIEHSVQVTADSLYEAGLRGIAAFRAMPMRDMQPGIITELRLAVHSPEHNVRVGQLLEWAKST